MPPGEIPEPLIAFEALCSQCTEIYQELRASFSKDELVYNGDANQWSRFHAVLRRIEEILQTLASPGAEQAVVKQYVLRASRLRGGRRTAVAAA